MELTADYVAQVATLARISIKPEELSQLGQELSGIFHWIDQLEKVDIAGVENYSDSHPYALPEREDKVTDGGCVDEVLANAPEKSHDMFAVPRVV